VLSVYYRLLVCLFLQGHQKHMGLLAGVSTKQILLECTEDTTLLTTTTTTTTTTTAAAAAAATTTATTKLEL